MKYIELVKDNNNKIVRAEVIDIGELYQTVNGELIQAIQGKIRAILQPGDWTFLVESIVQKYEHTAEYKVNKDLIDTGG